MKEIIELNYNETLIQCPIKEGHRMIPVKTICEIIDVSYPTQDNWLRNHSLFGQLYRLAYTTGRDGKQYEMRCLATIDCLIWLGSIGDNNRKIGSKEKQEALIAWLRDKFTAMYKLIEIIEEENRYEQSLIDKKRELEEEIAANKVKNKELSDELKQVNESLVSVRDKRYTGQTAIPFPSTDQKMVE